MQKLSSLLPAIIFVLLVSIAHLSYGIPFTYRYSNSIENIPPELRSGVIQAIHRDRNGFLWIGTQDGLYKYDGNNVVGFNTGHLTSEHAIAGDILAISETHDGRLLAATDPGSLLIWNPETQQFDSHSKFGNESLPFVRDMAVSPSGEIWLVIDEFVLQLSPNLTLINSWSCSHKNMDSPRSCNSIAIDDTENVVIGSVGGIFFIEPAAANKRWISFNSEDIPAHSRIVEISRLNDTHMLLGTDTGKVILFNPNTRKVDSHVSLTKSETLLISSFLSHSTGIMVGTDIGLFHLSEDFSVGQPTSILGEGEPKINIYSLELTPKSVVAGTFSGLRIYTPEIFSNVRIAPRENQVDVTGFSASPGGELWIASSAGLFVSCLNDEKICANSEEALTILSQSIPTQKITTLEFGGGKIWIGTYKGQLQYYDLNAQHYDSLQIPGVPHFEITDLLYLQETRELWISTFEHGVFRFSNNKFKSFGDSGKLLEKQVFRFLQIDADHFLILNYEKIYSYNRDSDSFSALNFEYGVPPEEVTHLSIAVTPNQDIWIGTKHHGLYYWPWEKRNRGDLRLEPFSGSIQTGSQAVQDIQVDTHGNLWFTNPKRLLKLDPKTGYIYQFPQFSTANDGEFSWGSSYQDAHGRIYFGGINDYIGFHPDEVRMDVSIPTTILSAVHFPTKSFINIPPPQNQKTIEITHKDHFVTFEFSVNDFIGYRENEFKYKLEGFDPEWRDNGNDNSATYTNLPPGDYTLRAVGANAAGIWDPDGLAITVTVLPPPWRSWWAYCLYTIAAFFTLFTMLRTYQSYVIERRARDLAIEMNISADAAENELQEQMEFQDELLDSAYSHKIDSLNVIRAAMKSSASEATMQSEVNALSSGDKVLLPLTLMEDCMHYGVGGPAGDLHKFAELSTNALLAEGSVDPDSVILVNEIPEVLTPAPMCSVFAIILYELLHNTIHHAFAAESPANYIQLNLVTSREAGTANHVYELHYLDSGAGLPEGLIDSPTASSGWSIILNLLNAFSGTVETLNQSGTALKFTLVDSRTKPYA